MHTRSSEDIEKIINDTINKFASSDTFITIIKKAVSEILSQTIVPIFESKLNDCVVTISNLQSEINDLKHSNVELHREMNQLENKIKVESSLDMTKMFEEIHDRDSRNIMFCYITLLNRIRPLLVSVLNLTRQLSKID